MKKLLSLVLAFVFLVCLAACSRGNEDVTTTVAPPQTAVPSNASFITPAAFCPMSDIGSELPSATTLHFEFDANGRILSCAYDYGSGPVTVNYLYAENSIGVTAMAGATRLAEASFAPHGEFDADNGYVEYEGYYFFGYTFD